MTQLLQRIANFLYHVIDAPETAPDTREAAEELMEDVTDQINQPDTTTPNSDETD